MMTAVDIDGRRIEVSEDPRAGLEFYDEVANRVYYGCEIPLESGIYQLWECDETQDATDARNWWVEKRADGTWAQVVR